MNKQNSNIVSEYLDKDINEWMHKKVYNTSNDELSMGKYNKQCQ